MQMRVCRVAVTLLLTLATPVIAGDPTAGARVFAQRCAVCHQIIRDDGTTVVRGGGSGPNQYGIIGRQAGTVSDYGGYGEALIAAGEGGLIWTETELADYLADPRAFLRERTGDGRAGSRMAFRLRDETARADVAAFLASVE